MPEHEDVAVCIDVAVMRRAPVAAIPSSHSKTGSTFRTAGGNDPAADVEICKH